MTLVRRAVASPESVPTSAKATLFVTLDVDALLVRLRATVPSGGVSRGGGDGLRGGTTVGSADAGSLLDPATLRRLACDAGLIPTVLGPRGEVLDLGREVRLFTPGQQKVLWLRDRHCTIPGCSIPAQWCDAHHLVHWADGGTTEIGNAALLCGYHHSWVHTKRVAGLLVVDPGRGERVEWDLRPGSYRGPRATRLRATKLRTAKLWTTVAPGDQRGPYFAAPAPHPAIPPRRVSGRAPSRPGAPSSARRS